jgi:hypothetical protein
MFARVAAQIKQVWLPTFCLSGGALVSGTAPLEKLLRFR